MSASEPLPRPPAGAPAPSDGTRSGPSGAVARASAGASAGTPTPARGSRWTRSPWRWSARGSSRSCVRCGRPSSAPRFRPSSTSSTTSRVRSSGRAERWSRSRETIRGTCSPWRFYRDRRLPSDTSETGKWPLTGCFYPSSFSLASESRRRWWMCPSSARLADGRDECSPCTFDVLHGAFYRQARDSVVRRRKDPPVVRGRPAKRVSRP